MVKKKQGFTLLEMIIALALTVTVLGIANSMFIAGNKVFSDSDVKSTLQMEANDIQEQLTSIGMQGKVISSIEINGQSSDDDSLYVNKKYSQLVLSNINEMKIEIQAYDKDSEYSDAGNISNPKPYDILFDHGTLSVNSKILSTNVYSFNVSPQNTDDSFANSYSIQFDIKLNRQEGFTNIKYPVNIKVTFRNK